MKFPLPGYSEFAKYWSLDRDSVFLNHGSFGACPKFILDKQVEYRKQLEANPMRFFIRQMEGIFEDSRRKVAGFVNADADDLVFVQNATTAVNTVFRSLRFTPGDEILFTNHIYGACRRLLEFVADQTGAKLVEANFEFPVASPGIILDAILEKVTARTRIALVDHISSASALIHPVENIVSELEKRGVDTFVDGAHAIGSIPLDLEKTGAAYYTANCHKWLCAPKSAAILHVRRDKQHGLYPVVISHAGHRAEPFSERFFWPGTWDPTPMLCVGDAIDYLDSLFPGGWPALMQRNHDLCLEARALVCNVLEIEPPCPGSMIASMAAIPLPLTSLSTPPDYKSFDSWQEQMFNEYRIEIPSWQWEAPPTRLTRISVQLYNSPDQYRYFASILKSTLNH
jgi:isopenicillin-N epimerase